MLLHSLCHTTFEDIQFPTSYIFFLYLLFFFIFSDNFLTFIRPQTFVFSVPFLQEAMTSASMWMMDVFM